MPNGKPLKRTATRKTNRVAVCIRLAKESVTEAKRRARAEGVSVSDIYRKTLESVLL